ncbi:MAG: hypothetical protein DRP45_09445 [Candidatus Zixiibacteriota bacterium]|nr:MAG: hypothetical protein DRP45_09445 [candidate division Zixibacteria bacterium]
MRTNAITTVADKPMRYVALFLLATTLVLLFASSAQPAASVHSSARSAGMGGAFTALAKGVDAPKYNPANLGLDGYRQTGFEFASVGASITNNAFTLSDYNNYTGATLSTSDKQDIMNKIPDEGFRIDADIRANAASLALGHYVLSFNGVASANANINKDVMDLILNGNQFADTIHITGSYSDGISYASMDLSYGFQFHSQGTRQFALGVTAKYIKGLYAEQLVELTGHASTYESGFEGQGSAIVRTATSGSGYGLDVGAALKLNNRYTAGVRFQNILGKITWNKDTEEHGYTYVLDATTYDDFEDDDFGGSDDYSIEIGNFSTTLPRSMNIGFAKTSGKLLWAVDWVQGFETKPGVSTKPLLAMGTEYSVFGIAPLRLGYSVGGNKNAAFSFGSGVRFMGFYLDAAIRTGTSMTVYSAKGANFTISTGLVF